MAKSIKKVEAVFVNLKDNFSFSEIIRSEHMNKKFYPPGKVVQLKFLDEKPDYIFGVMVTTKQSGIPPKHDTVTDTYNPLDLNNNEGLGYANSFIFVKRYNLLLYEFNKNGTYLNSFRECVMNWCKETPFEDAYFTFEALLNLETYERMLNMTFYKSIEVKIAQPDALIEGYKGKNESVENTLQLGADSDADYLSLKLGVSSHRKAGLLNNFIQRFANTFQRLGLKYEDDKLVKKITIEGYETDPDGEEQKTKIDLILDKYKLEFKLEEPRILDSLQVIERKTEVINLYTSNLGDFTKIFKLRQE